MNPSAPHARFDAGVDAWRAYLRSPLGRMRATLVAEGLEPLAARLDERARVLDAGCGLADHGGLFLSRGCTLWLCDFAPAMLRAAEEDLRRRFPDAGARLRTLAAPVAELPERLEARSFDLVLAHTVLEFVGDAAGTLETLAGLLRPGGTLSCVVVNRHSEVWRAAVGARDPAQAMRFIDERHFTTPLFGDAPKRTFDEAEIRGLLDEAGLSPGPARGLRIFADFYPPAAFDDPAAFGALLALERAAADRAPHRQLARYLHVVARKSSTRRSQR